MLNLIKVTLALLLMSFSISISAAPRLGNECNEILVSDERGSFSVADGESATICDSDFITAMMNLMLSSVYEADSLVVFAYDLLDIPPPARPDQIEQGLYGMIALVPEVTLRLFYFVLLPIALAYVIYRSVIIFSSNKREKGAGEGYLGGNVAWFVGFGLFAFLCYPLDNYMIGQVLVIAVAFSAIKIATILLSGMIFVMNFENDMSGEISESQFFDDGMVFARSSVSELVALRQSAIALNLSNIRTEFFELTEAPDDLSGFDPNMGVINESHVIRSMFSGKKDVPVTPESLIYSFLTSSSASYSASSPMTGIYGIEAFNDNLGFSSHVGLGQSTSTPLKAMTYSSMNASILGGIGLFRDSSGPGGFYEPMARSEIGEEELYESPNIAKTTLVLNDNDSSIIHSALGSGLSREFSYENLSSSSFNVDAYSARLLEIASGNSSRISDSSIDSRFEFEKGFIHAAGSVLLGFYDLFDHKNLGNEKAVWLFNPMNSDAFNTSGDAPLFSLLKDAKAAEIAFLKSQCLTHVFDRDGFRNILSQADLYSDFVKGATRLSPSSFNHAFQCLGFNSDGVIEFYLPKSLIGHLDKLNEMTGVTDYEKYEIIISSKGSYKSDIDSYDEEFELMLGKMATYVGNVKYLINNATIHLVSEYDNSPFDLAQTIRKYGVASVPSFFMKATSERGRLTSYVVGNNVEPARDVFVDGDFFIPSFDGDFIEDEPLVYDRIISSMMTFGEVFGFKSNGLVSESLVSTTVDELGFVETVKAEVVGRLIDSLVVGDSILVRGFGLGDEGTSLSEALKSEHQHGGYSVTQHPILTLAEVGQSMILSGVSIVLLGGVVDAAMNAPDLAIDRVVSSFGQVGDRGTTLLSGALSMFSGAFKIFLFSLKAVFILIEPLAKLYIFVGFILHFALPIVVVVRSMLAWLFWILNVIFLFTLYPLLIFLVFVRQNGKRLLSLDKFLNLHINVLMIPILNLIAFTTFFLMSHILILGLIGLLFILYPSKEAVLAGFGIYQVLFFGLSINVVLYLIYRFTMHIEEHCYKFPSYLFKFLEREQIGSGETLDIESVVGAAAISHGVQSGVSGASDKLVNNVAMKAAKKQIRSEHSKGVDFAMREQRRTVQLALDKSGHNVDLELLLSEK